jgi:hypothetical protein
MMRGSTVVMCSRPHEVGRFARAPGLIAVLASPDLPYTPAHAISHYLCRLRPCGYPSWAETAVLLDVLRGKGPARPDAPA